MSGAPGGKAAATVILLRDGAQGLETLMLRRNSKLAFVGGMWVFPGGRVDPGDRTGLLPDDELGAARRAAVREAGEEAGLEIDPGSLITLSHWQPPGSLGRHRFLTWFFVTTAPGGPVAIDHGEIHDHAWMRPAHALERRDAGEIEMAPPTWVTLDWLRAHDEARAALAAARAREPERFATHMGETPEGRVAMWHGDAGYESGDAATPGPRHRLWLLDSGWRYERD